MRAGARKRRIAGFGRGRELPQLLRGLRALAGPPVGGAREAHDGRHQHSADDERVDEHGKHEVERALVQKHLGAEEEPGEGNSHDDASGRDDAARLAQAEHDEMAQSILISSSEALLAEVDRRSAAQCDAMHRADIIRASLTSRGALIHVRDIDEAMDIVNQLAPEHLELALSNPELALPLVKAAGAIFMGHHAGEVIGDYTAGPSHVLPTSRTARFASPLGVYDFQVRSSVVQCSAKGAVRLSRDAAILAEAEGLFAHAASAGFRVQG